MSVLLSSGGKHFEIDKEKDRNKIQSSITFSNRFIWIPLEDFCAGDLQVDHDGGEGGLGELAGVVDGVAVHHDQLHRAAQLEDALDLGLDLGQVRGAAAVLLKDLAVGGIVQNGGLAEREVHRHVRDDDPALELVLEELEHGLLQHVRHLVPLQRGPHHHHGPHDRHHVEGGEGLALLAQEPLLLLDDGGRGDPHPARALLAGLGHVRLGGGGGRVGGGALGDTAQGDIRTQ